MSCYVAPQSASAPVQIDSQLIDIMLYTNSVLICCNFSCLWQAFVASVQAQQADLTALKHLATVLMLQATSASPPTPGSSPLSSPEASDLNERSSTFPPLPSCKLSEAFVQLAARLQNLHQKALTHQHKLDDALQQLHELLAAMEVFCGWIREAEKKIEEPLGERGQMRTLQRQLEICLVSFNQTLPVKTQCGA